MSGSWIDSVPLRNIVESDDRRGELQDLLSILGGAGGASNRPSTSRAGGVGSATSIITEMFVFDIKAGTPMDHLGIPVASFGMIPGGRFVVQGKQYYSRRMKGEGIYYSVQL